MIKQNEKNEKKEINLAFLSENNYSNNLELDKEYKAMSRPNSRFTNVFLYNTLVAFGYYYVARNIVFLRRKIYKTKEFSYMRVLKMIVFFTFVPTVLLIPNVFILYGAHPIKYFRERREIEERLLSSSELKDTIMGLDHIYRTDIESTTKVDDENVEDIIKSEKL